jgi:hypothetical protein
MVYLHTKFQMPWSSRSLSTAIKPKTKYNFRAAPMLLYVLQEVAWDKNCNHTTFQNPKLAVALVSVPPPKIDKYDMKLISVNVGWLLVIWYSCQLSWKSLIGRRIWGAVRWRSRQTHEWTRGHDDAWSLRLLKIKKVGWQNWVFTFICT